MKIIDIAICVDNIDPKGMVEFVVLDTTIMWAKKKTQ